MINQKNNYKIKNIKKKKKKYNKNIKKNSIQIHNFGIDIFINFIFR